MTFELAAIARSSLVLAMGLVLIAALRHQPAAFRHAVLAAAIVLAAAQPAANLLMPAWILPAMWSVPAGEGTAVSAPQVETSTSFELIAPLPAASSAIAPATIAFWIWAAGAAIGLAAMALAALWLHWVGRRGRAARGDWVTVARELSRAFGIQRPVRLCITMQPAVLATWGLIRPTVLLPSDADTWPPDRIRAVLAHELAHVARHDWLIHVLAEAARAVYWFNPLFWVASARLRRDSEHACDDIVIEHGIGAASYAAHLVDLARAFRGHGRTWVPAPSMARPSTLERRIRIMLSPRLDRPSLPARARSAVIAALLVATLPIATASQGSAAPSGTVTDPSGRLVPNVTVRLTSVTSDAAFETQTDATGAYQFPAVPPGEYLLTARSMGFLSMRRRVSVTANTAALPIQMQVGTLQETVTVGGQDSGDGPRREQRRAPYARAACTPQETGGHIVPPSKTRHVSPRYKKAWLDAGLEGSILLEARIDVNGRVRELEVVSPVNAELEEEAIGAVSRWEFTPTWLNCQPVEVRMFVTVSFNADR